MDIQFPAILFQIINFTILFIILRKFLYKPILKVLDKRADRIKEGLEAAEKNISYEKEFIQKRDEVIAKAKKEAAAIIKDSQTKADALVREAEVKAKEVAKKAQAKEIEAFEAHKKLEMAEFRSRANQFILDAVDSVVHDLVDFKVSQKIVDEQIKKLDSKLI